MSTCPARGDGYIPPCIPTRAFKVPSGPDWIHEVKHDGYWLQVRREGEAVRLYTRRGFDWTDRYPAIVRTALKLTAKSCTLDGEAVVCGEDGIAVFADLHRRGVVTEAMLYAFDLLEFGGEDLRPFPLSDRKRLLAKVVGRRSLGIVLSEHTDVDIFQQVCKMGLEGVVSKRLSSPYRSGRSTDGLTIKNPDSPALAPVRNEEW
jgi:bifunctional non-homologous end joining protein LigD